MQESCACGAYIKTTSYRRVKDWRDSHRHDMAAEEVVEPDKQGAFAIVEQADEPHGYGDGERFFPNFQARIGFTMNPVQRANT